MTTLNDRVTKAVSDAIPAKPALLVDGLLGNAAKYRGLLDSALAVKMLPRITVVDGVKTTIAADEAAETEAKDRLRMRWAESQPDIVYDVTSEAEGTISTGSGKYTLTAAYAVAMEQAAFNKMPGKTANLSTLRGQVGALRTACNKYVGNTYNRWVRDANEVKRERSDPKDFWDYINSHIEAMVKRTKKDAVDVEDVINHVSKAFRAPK